MPPRRVCLVLGTRPEVIKLAPVAAALRATGGELSPFVVTTGQHGEMVDQALRSFGLRPDVQLGIAHSAGGIGSLFEHVADALGACFRDVRPAAVLVQGDTTSAAAAAVSAYGSSLLLGHVEAGLRSGSLQEPFPEELNRRMIGCVADLHFAPTQRAADNLLREGVSGEDVLVTGNTVVDALRMMPARARFADAALHDVDWAARRVVLVTAHRRENWRRLPDVCDALVELAARFRDVELLVPVHRNPMVGRVVRERLANVRGVRLLEPLEYGDLLEVLRRCHFVLSDSGGLQEEAPSFAKPILILRDCTERPEVLTSGFGALVGTETRAIVDAASRLLTSDDAYAGMLGGRNPFGDGRAGVRIAAALGRRLSTRVMPPPLSRRTPRPMRGIAPS